MGKTVERRSVSMGSRKRNIIFIIIWTTLISISIGSLATVSCAKEVELGADVSIQEPALQTPDVEKNKIDPFNVAIITISLGCMMIVSSVHWHMSTRQDLEMKIKEFNGFLKSTCAVELNIGIAGDNDPMVNSAQTMQSIRNNKIAELENKKDSTNRLYSEIEVEIMRMVG